jgi:hypothetical protein
MGQEALASEICANLRRNIDVDANRFVKAAIHWAVDSGKPSLVQLVIDRGVDVSRRVQVTVGDRTQLRSVGYNLAWLNVEDEVKLKIMKLLINANLQVTQDGALVVKELITTGQPCIPLLKYLFTPVGGWESRCKSSR